MSFVGTQLSDSDKKNVDEKVRKLEETMSKVEWNGKKFVPKPMTLTRINLSKMSNSQKLSNNKITASRSSGDYTMPVTVNLDAESSYRSHYEDLSAKLRETEKAWRLAISSVQQETATNLNDLKTTLTDSLTLKQKVYFSARWPISRPETDLLSVGWEIGVETGILTVPRDGYYALFFQSFNYNIFQNLGVLVNMVVNPIGSVVVGPTDPIKVSIMRNNGERIVTAQVMGKQPFTLAAVQRLSKGDKLSLVHEHDNVFQNLHNLVSGPKNPISLFSGFSID